MKTRRNNRKLYETIMTRVAKEVKRALNEGEMMPNEGKYFVWYYNDDKADYLASGEDNGWAGEIQGDPEGDEDGGLREIPPYNTDYIGKNLNNLPAPLTTMEPVMEVMDRIWELLDDNSGDAEGVVRMTKSEACDIILSGGVFSIPSEGNFKAELVDYDKLVKLIKRFHWNYD